MKIKKIQLKNIGPYVDHNGFDFDIANSVKRMILIGGKNGAGKTTTIKMLTGLTAKDGGSISYDNLSIDTHLDKIQQFTNLSPQETAIAENLTVMENIIFIAQIYGMNKLQAQLGCQRVMEQFDLTKVANILAKKERCVVDTANGLVALEHIGIVVAVFHIIFPFGSLLYCII